MTSPSLPVFIRRLAVLLALATAAARLGAAETDEPLPAAPLLPETQPAVAADSDGATATDTAAGDGDGRQAAVDDTDADADADSSAAGAEPGNVDNDAGEITLVDARLPDDGPRPFSILGTLVPPGETRQLGWYAGDSFTGAPEPTPVFVAHGVERGQTLCVTAAIHGDELNGIEISRQLLYDIDPQRLKGTVIAVPIVNLHGFRQGSRYLPDRRDLNRHFPGHPDGSAASRIAYSLFESVIRHCDALVDLHTGSFHRTNLPQIRADLNIPGVRELTKGFGATAVLHGTGPNGSIRKAATDADIPAVTLEAGEPMRFQPEEVEHGVRALQSLLRHLGMTERFRRWGEPQPLYYESHWVRADHGGILVSRVTLGQRVKEGDILGTITDPITSRRNEVRSPWSGRVLGMALNQAVIPGFAAYHVGIERSEEDLAEPQAEENGAAEEAPETASDAMEEPPQDEDEASRPTSPQPLPDEASDLHLD